MATAAVQGSVPVRSRVPGFILVIAGLALTSGTIHLIAAAEHVGDDWLLGAFFALVGVGQVMAAWWTYRNPDDLRVLKLLAVGSIIVSLLWVFSRTTGIAFGPEPGRASVGVADTITTVQQFAVAAIVVALLSRPERGGGRLAWMGGPLANRLTFALLTVTMLLAAVGGHEH
ncbi:MAG: hypothetical protein M3376_09840 [Actinomycetota bacterium]|nr:hypothetical protein [Actinomycetota bacterium]